VDPALYELLSEADESDEVEALIRVTDVTAEFPDVRLVSRFGSIATCRLPRTAIPDVRERESVESLKAPRLLAPEEGSSGGEEEIISAWGRGDERRSAGLEPTGKAVVIGVLDWGADFGCDAFRETDGSTRLLALWDQRGPTDPRQPYAYGYGKIHTRDAINAALRAADPYGALGYHPGDADPFGTGSHGTHVSRLGISAACPPLSFPTESPPLLTVSRPQRGLLREGRSSVWGAGSLDH